MNISKRIKIILIIIVALGICANGKGIGMPYVFPDDLEKVNADWYYTWGACPNDSNCVPMSWGSADPNLPLDYSGYILLFNEPDRPEQSNITPEAGFAIYKSLHQKYPLVKWVVGNTFSSAWLYQFKELCTEDIMPTTWGIHAYVGDIEYLPQMLVNLENAHTQLGGDFWITEFACVFGDISCDNGLVHFFQTHNWIKRWAYFCNRAKGDEWWFPQAWHDFELFDWNGELTEAGKWYKRTGAEHKIYLPIVRKDWRKE